MEKCVSRRPGLKECTNCVKIQGKECPTKVSKNGRQNSKADLRGSSIPVHKTCKRDQVQIVAAFDDCDCEPIGDCFVNLRDDKAWIKIEPEDAESGDFGNVEDVYRKYFEQPQITRTPSPPKARCGSRFSSKSDQIFIPPIFQMYDYRKSNQAKTPTDNKPHPIEAINSNKSSPRSSYHSTKSIPEDEDENENVNEHNDIKYVNEQESNSISTQEITDRDSVSYNNLNDDNNHESNDVDIGKDNVEEELKVTEPSQSQSNTNATTRSNPNKGNKDKSQRDGDDQREDHNDDFTSRAKAIWKHPYTWKLAKGVVFFALALKIAKECDYMPIPVRDYTPTLFSTLFENDL